MMHASISFRSFWLLASTLSVLFQVVISERFIESKSLNPCQESSSFSASLFNVVFTPSNGSLAFHIIGFSSISGYVEADFEIIAYGIKAFNKPLDPCTNNLPGMCPMNTGPININSNFNLPPNIQKQIPGIAYGVPDLDGLARIYINDTQTHQSVACVEAELSNGKTVNLAVVGWITAVIAGLALVASAVISGLGHSNTAAHVAANALSLFGFFQSQAIIGMTAVPLPPIVMSWTQNFQWSMGIIRVGFLQDITTWYQRATGGKPATLLSTLTAASVQVQKRSVEVVNRLFMEAQSQVVKRASPAAADSSKVVVVQGITRVGFRAQIEHTNIFLTGLIFFMVFVVFTAIGVALFKAFCEFAVKAGWFNGNRFEDFRNGWKIVLKGILFRLVLIGYPQMCVLCLWELTQKDSAAEVVLALFFFVSMTVALSWAALKVFRIAKRSVNMHQSPAYILFSDPTSLNKWGFLYVQFRATAYYFIIPVLCHILIKALFIAFSQKNGIVQAVGLLIIEAVFLIAVSIIRPWMDAKTNGFNISIAAINFLDAIFLLVFTKVFNQPGIVTGVMGVLFFVINAFFATVLLLMVIFATGFAIFMKNPDTRYQPMRDDRGSFIKSATQLNQELDALGATARGDMVQTPYNKARDFDADDDSYSSLSGKHQHDAAGIPLPPSTANSNRSPSRHRDSRDPPRSPIDSSMPFFPNDGPPRHSEPAHYDENPRGMYNGYNDSSQPGADFPLLNPLPNSSHSPSRGQAQQMYSRSGSLHSNSNYRQRNNSSPWQVGAGYDH